MDVTIKSFSTNINPDRTIMEIEKILSRFGAKAILKDYEGSSVKAISFYLEHEDQRIPFKLPMNIDKARGIVERVVDERTRSGARRLPLKFKEEPYRTEKARAVGWRIIRDWIHAQLSLLEMEFASPVEILLPYAYNPIKGKTLYELFSDNDKFLEFKGEEE